MVQNYYAEQVELQQMIHRISIVVAVVFFLAAVVLIARNCFRGKRQRLLAGAIALLLTCSFQSSAVTVDANPAAQVTVIEGSRGDGSGLYRSDVLLQICWQGRDSILISRNAEGTMAVLELSYLSEQSIETQIAASGIPGLVLQSSSGGVGETCQAILRFSSEGRYQISQIMREQTEETLQVIGQTSLLELTIDRTSPELLVYSEMLGEEAQVFLSASDIGTGISGVQYAIVAEDTDTGDGPAISESLWREYTGIISLTEAGSFSVWGRARDLAGNIQYSSSQSIRIEKTDPELEEEENKKAADNKDTDTKKKSEEDASELKDIISPVVNMSMRLLRGNDGLFYAMDQTMLLEVTEENFDTSCLPTVLTGDSHGYSFSGWQKTETGVRGVLSFEKDGYYTVVFQARDQAGNLSERITSETFILDRRVPEIEVRGVEDQGVYAENVLPTVYIEDTDICLSSLEYSVTGARSGPLEAELMAEVRQTDTGIAIVMQQFPEDVDDVYTLAVQATDQAGNEIHEEVVFAMDKNGSEYIFSDETEALVDRYYMTEPMDLVLSEINTSKIVYKITVDRDGDLQELKEEEDYSVEVRGGDGDWMIYTYRIFADNFQKEGVYHVDITSWDQAENVNNNQVRGARIDFAVDKNHSGQQADGQEQDAFPDEQSTAAEEKTVDDNTVISGTQSGRSETAEPVTDTEDTSDEKGTPLLIMIFVVFAGLAVTGSMIFLLIGKKHFPFRRK